jgi:subtilisin family serine protease
VIIVFAAKIPSGFHGDGLFIILESQADLSTSATISNATEKRAAVYQQLIAHAQITQQPLRTRLDRFGIDSHPYYLVNAIEVRGGPLLRLWLERQPGVSRVLDNPWMRPLPRALPVSTGHAPAPDQIPWNIELIQADRVWEEFGDRGQGILIGNSDSGMQADHPEIRDRYRGLGSSNDYNWYDPWNHTRQPTDFGGHGTHTLGIVLGKNTGVAPDAQWIGCVNLARNLGNPGLYLSCLQFMLAPFPQDGDPFLDGRPELGAQVLNNSWGCPAMEGCDEQSLEPAVQALRAAGVFVVVSAGNDGPFCGSLTSPPAIYDGGLSVGAVDSLGSLAMFSSIGQDPTTAIDGVKPDLVAPGVEVLSAFPNSTYAIQSGTSMAGPHVAGVVALIWSANPALIGDIDRTEQILISSAQPYSGALPDCPGASASPSTAVGYGVVDAYQAVQLALQSK